MQQSFISCNPPHNKSAALPCDNGKGKLQWVEYETISQAGNLLRVPHERWRCSAHSATRGYGNCFNAKVPLSTPREVPADNKFCFPGQLPSINLPRFISLAWPL